MAVESRRQCGYRKVGGIYLCGSGAGHECDRLPYPLTICPCCSAGIKQSRGWTWINVPLLTGGVHRDCLDGFPCPFCMATDSLGACGLLWIGQQFYKTPGEFTREADGLGISRRIAAVPRAFKIGHTWVLLAHPQGAPCPRCQGSGLEDVTDENMATVANAAAALLITGKAPCSACEGTGKCAGIFRVFRPDRIEKIITESQSRNADVQADLARRGFTAVVVPDDDGDHQGTVYDD